jgi:tetratricopeptide (TPR) repeat protein
MNPILAARQPRRPYEAHALPFSAQGGPSRDTFICFGATHPPDGSGFPATTTPKLGVFQLFWRALTHPFRSADPKPPTPSRKAKRRLERDIDISRTFLHFNQPTAAEETLKDLLACQIKLLGPQHLLLTKPLQELVNVYRHQQNEEKLDETLHTLLRIYEANHGETALQLLPTLNNLGCNALNNERYDEGESFLLRGLSIIKKKDALMHPMYPVLLSNLGGIYLEQGKYKSAETVLQQAMEAYEIKPPVSLSRFRFTLRKMAALMAATQRPEEAQALKQRIADTQG